MIRSTYRPAYSAAALPDTALYGVRLLRENVALALAPTDTAGAASRWATRRTTSRRCTALSPATAIFKIARALMGDALAYNQRATAARPVAVPLARRPGDGDRPRVTARRWHDSAWQRVAGVVIGRRAMDAHLAALRRIVDNSAPSSLSERSLPISCIMCGRAKPRLQLVSWPQSGLQA